MITRDNAAGITTGEWKSIKENHLDHFMIYASNVRHVADVCRFANSQEEEANAHMIALAGNLSQKYGSLEELEKLAVRLNESFQSEHFNSRRLKDENIKLQAFQSKLLKESDNLKRQLEEKAHECDLKGTAYEVMRDRAFEAERSSAIKFANFIKEFYTSVKGKYRHKGDFEKSRKLQNIDSVLQHFTESIKLK